MSACVSSSSSSIRSTAATTTDDDNCESPPGRPTPTTESPPRRLPLPALRPRVPARPPLPTPTPIGRGLHKHLLLVTGQVYQEYIGDCSVAGQARDLQDLDAMLRQQQPPKPSDDDDSGTLAGGDFVLIQVGTGWRLDVRLLDVLVDRLGNVSVYADKKYYSKTMAEHCRNIGARCTLLVNLVPVLEQFEADTGTTPGTKNGGGGGGGDVMYDPDWIPVPALPPLPRNFSGSTEKQIEHLTWRLCVRDRRRNLYYRLDKDTLPAALRYKRALKQSPPASLSGSPHNPSSSSTSHHHRRLYINVQRRDVKSGIACQEVLRN